MKKIKILFVTGLMCIGILLTACGKGYEVRVTNYNTELLDTVIVGKQQLIFANIERQSTTEYKKIDSGDQFIRIITKTKKEYTSTIPVPKKGTGKRTIQIDGLNRISVLED
ncbi:MAG: hypothetical protein Q8L81_02435 [Bacteroidota bacterium]|nr:hypothetical protein [Bacteroidota bacterium]